MISYPKPQMILIISFKLRIKYKYKKSNSLINFQIMVNNMLFKQEQTAPTFSSKNNKTHTLIFPSVFTSNKEDANTTIIAGIPINIKEN